MRKYTAIFLALLSLAFCLVGCNSKKDEKYASIIADSANDIYSVESEIDYWTGTYFEKEHMGDKTCQVFGNHYSGSYSQSIVDKMNSYTTDIYVDDNHIEFGLRDDNGELAYINLMNANFFDTQPYLPDVDNPSEAAISLATQIASEYVDIADYTQIIEEPMTRYKEREGITYEITYYIVTFAKKVNGYFSSDFISVKVTSKGTLASIMIGDINAFSDVSIAFEETTMNQSISKKIESTYKNSKFNMKNSNVEDQKIVLTPNGDICMYSDIVVEGVEDSNTAVSTRVVILTVLGKKNKA